MKTLDEIAQQYEGRKHPTIDTDKSAHGYAAFYDEILGHLRDQPCKIMDIGVNTGGSIRMWEEGFPLATIIGVDHKSRFPTPGPQTTLFRFDVTTPGKLLEVCKAHGPFDFVIDDAAHSGPCTKAILMACFPDYIKPGGWLFVEDIHASYFIKDTNGHLDVVKDLVNAICHHGALRHAARVNWKEERTRFDSEIHQLVFRPGIVGIQRYKP